MAEVPLCHTTSIVSYPGINRGNLFSYSARLSCSRVYPISGNTQSVSAIAGSLSHIVYGLQDPHSSWPTSFGSIIINSPLCSESHRHSNVSMQTSVSVHPRTDCLWVSLRLTLQESLVTKRKEKNSSRLQSPSTRT